MDYQNAQAIYTNQKIGKILNYDVTVFVVKCHEAGKNFSFMHEISLNFSSASTSWRMSDPEALSGWKLSKARLYAART